MNTRQLQYAVMLAEARSFSQVAEQLGITQPALSKQIISLEQELGVRLFDRSTTPLTLTPAGEHFVRKGEQLLYEEDQLLRTMESYRTGSSGRLTIGVSPFRSLYLMPPLIRQMQARYPGIRITLAEVGTSALHKGVLEGQYDFAIMNLPVDESRLVCRPLEKDTLVLAVPDSMLPLLPEAALTQSTLDLADCGALPFVTLGSRQELRLQFDTLCRSAGIAPRIHVEVVGIATAWAMVQSGVAASVLPQQFIRHSDTSGVTLFPLRQTASTRQPAVVWRRDQFMPEYAACAIRLLTGEEAP